MPCHTLPLVAPDNYKESKMTQGDSKWLEITQEVPKRTIHLLECAIPTVAALTNLEINTKVRCNGCYTYAVILACAKIHDQGASLYFCICFVHPAHA